jgi:hypothetical protein
MKITKISLIFLILIIFFVLGDGKKSKNNSSKNKIKRNYSIKNRISQFEPTILLDATRAYFIKIISPNKKTNDEVQACIDLVSEDSKVERHAQKLMKKLKKKILKNLPFSTEDPNKFFNGIDSSRIGYLKGGERHQCGEVLRNSLIDENELKSEHIQNLLKTEMTNKLGLVSMNASKTNYLSHLINIRPSVARNPNFFGRLNGNYKK